MNIQMPKQMDYNDGESVVKRASGLIRHRKGQTEEEYVVQRNSFWNAGPLVQDNTYVSGYIEKVIENNPGDHLPLTEQTKIERETIMHGLERLYFERKYERCLKDVEIIKAKINQGNDKLDLSLKKNKNLKRVLGELDTISDMCIKKLHTQNESNLKNI